MKSFEEYADQIDSYTNKINLKRSTRDSSNKGSRGIISKIVFSKAAWQEALTYFAILQSIVIFTALIPDAIENINSVFVMIGIPFQFPVNLSSLGAVMFIIFLFIFGFVGYRKLRTPAIAQSYGNKNNSAMYLIWDQLEEIKESLEEREK